MGDQLGGITWYRPDPRCIIDLDKFHVSQRLNRTFKHKPFEIKINTVFSDVIKACARCDTTEGVWISDEIVDVYCQLNKLGFAHSVEAFSQNELVGGLYGVAIGGAFMGESMFHKRTDASKLCLMYLVEHLRKQKFVLLDCQYQTSHLAKFGAELISSSEYLTRLNQALSLNCHFC